MMHDDPEMEYQTIDSAIRAGSCFYFDRHLYEEEGVSGGVICPMCKKWTTRPRKRKFPMHSWINDCESCEITDDFQRLWHKFNKNSNDMERDIYNNWLRQMRYYLEEMEHLSSYVMKENSKSKLKELIHKLPFFGV